MKDNTILLNVFAILSVASLCGIIYILAHSDLRKKIALPSMDDQQDDLIKKCIKDSFEMQEQINRSESSAELESHYFEIEFYESTWRGLVSNELLDAHINRLYDAVILQRDKLQIKVA